MEIKILNSARKHGLNDEEIKFAMQNAFLTKETKNTKGNSVFFCVGFLTNGQSCELIYYINKYWEFVVFHAMTPARNNFIKDVQSKRRF